MRHLPFRSTLLLATVAAAATMPAMAVGAEPYYEVNTIGAATHAEYRPNEVIVKFKDSQTVRMRSARKGSAATSGVGSVDEVLSRFGVGEAEQLMPLTGKLAAPQRVRAYNGTEVEVRDMSRLYCLRAAETIDVMAMVDALAALPEVEFAEPNYLVYACADGADYARDPLYSQQWGIPAVKADKLWDMPLLGGNRPVIAILDTGVDIYHPDLKDNIWTNEREDKGSAGYDDDKNGYADDIHGWDFVNQTGDINDYNGHGTHCAGIAAATGGNGIGIVGANPDALIMPVTVLQSDGTGDIGTIIKGIDYAAANGADVISMSLGGYVYSVAEEQALARAYSKAVLVAAAGNDGLCIYPHKCPINKEIGSPMFPAAFTFVLGVQANASSGMAAFSNFDEDGPIYFDPTYFSEEQMYNYELSAPGTSIISTYPGGKYKSLNGTSMACPLVAGAVSRLISAKEYESKELLFGDLIHTAGKPHVDFLAAYNLKDSDRQPNVALVSWRIEDETDQDGRFDAGEYINFYPTIRNDWGTARNIRVWVELGELEGKVIEFEKPYVDFEKPLSSYAKAESGNAIRFKIADDVVDGRHIKMNVNMQCDGMDAPVSQEIVFTAENGIEIGGMIDHDTTLEPGVSYIVTRTITVANGVTLTILPGTVLKFTDKSGISVSPNGRLNAIGTAENHIVFTSRDNASYPRVGFRCGGSDYGKGEYKYCVFRNLKILNASLATYVCLSECENCLFDDLSMDNGSFMWGGYFKYCWFNDVSGKYRLFQSSGESTRQLKGCNITNLYDIKNYKSEIKLNKYRVNTFLNNNIFNTESEYSLTGEDVGEVLKFDYPSYYGSSLESIVRKKIYDIENPNFTDATWKFDLSNMLLRPYPDAHGVVWKVMVDGYDAQDEFDMLPPLGVGRHKFEVYYSKVIDHSEAPTIAMGVRPPYTQTAIAEDGSWRTEDLTFNPFGRGKGNTDVINGTFDEYSNYWSAEGCYRSNESSNFNGFDGKALYSNSHQTGVPNKMYQQIAAAQNGRYKLQISAKVDKLAENNDCQYVYLNDSKVFLDENALKGAVYEVEAEVRNNEIEVGICQTENVSPVMYIDNVSLTLLEEYSNGRIEPVSVYTAYLDITGKMAIDGLNRIYVSGCEDLEHFPIPREDTRFNVEVAAAGSMSTGFYGEAGLGKVMLTWEDQDEAVDDILGYNLYRMADREVTDRYGNVSVVTDTVRINQRLLDETTYTDFDVVPGKTYSYYYKIMRTSMTENSPSRVVAVTPLTAAKGDANGSMSVDIADVVTEVGYMLAQDPQPFIFEAADVNSDNDINILDVVGTLNIIMQPSSTGVMTEGNATYWIEDGTLYVDSDVALAGVQFRFDGVADASAMQVLGDLAGMEIAGGAVDGSYLFMAYSMVGRTLAPGVHALVKLNVESSVSGVTMSDAQGHNVAVAPRDYSGVADATAERVAQPWPNPFIESVNIPYAMPFEGAHRVSLLFSDMSGRRIDAYTANGVTAGEYVYTWAPAVQPGVYFATLYIDGRPTGITYRLIKK